MIILLSKKAPNKQVDYLTEWLRDKNCTVQRYAADEGEMLFIGGKTGELDREFLASLDFIDGIKDSEGDCKAAGRTFTDEDTVVEVAGVKIGGGFFAVIAGPCSVESEAQIIETAKAVKEAGADILRGGAFKPRTSPYEFRGLEADGLKLLEKAKAETGLPIISEILDIRDLELFENVDMIQVGARNMQNFGMLRTLSECDKPVLLKRGPSATYREWLTAAEYLMAGGKRDIVLCERGIRTFEDYTRNTLDIAAVPALKELTHLTVIVDPSHGTGRSELVEPMALAAVAAGAGGIMVEVHNDPKNALSDGRQSIDPQAFAELMEKVRRVRSAICL